MKKTLTKPSVPVQSKDNDSMMESIRKKAQQAAEHKAGIALDEIRDLVGHNCSDELDELLDSVEKKLTLVFFERYTDNILNHAAQLSTQDPD